MLWWDSPACVSVWWVACSVRSSCGRARRRYTGSVRCCHVSTEGWRWLHSLHTHGPLVKNTQWHLWNFICSRKLPCIFVFNDVYGHQSAKRFQGYIFWIHCAFVWTHAIFFCCIINNVFPQQHLKLKTEVRVFSFFTICKKKVSLCKSFLCSQKK